MDVNSDVTKYAHQSKYTQYILHACTLHLMNMRIRWITQLDQVQSGFLYRAVKPWHTSETKESLAGQVWCH